MNYALVRADLKNCLPRLPGWFALPRGEKVCFLLINEAFAFDIIQRWILSGLKGSDSLLRGERSALKTSWRVLAGDFSWNHHRPCIVWDKCLVSSLFRKRHVFLQHVQWNSLTLSQETRTRSWVSQMLAVCFWSVPGGIIYKESPYEISQMEDHVKLTHLYPVMNLGWK